jgi:hypothetical protein
VLDAFSPRPDGADIHAVDLLALDAEGAPRCEKSVVGDETARRRAHGVAVVLDDVDDRQLPELGHVEALVDLALVGRAIAEIGERSRAVAAILVGEARPVPSDTWAPTMPWPP